VFYDRALDAWYHVDLADWMGRQHFYCGTFNLPNRLLINAALKRGDTYIDIGANQGVLTLQASRIVGPEGRVVAFEPNPEAFRIMKAHLVLNRRTNCELHNMGLSDEEGKLTLSLGEEHSGTATFRSLDRAVHKIPVPVRRGDSLLRPEELRGRVLVKIDTEGFEHRVVRGLGPLLDRVDTVFTIEVTDSWLRELGSSSGALFDDFLERGYRAYRLGLRPRGLAWALGLTPLNDAPTYKQSDVVFFRPETRITAD